MLPQVSRLSRPRDFDRIYRKGQRIKIGELLFFYQLSRNEATRLGFVVSKKISNKASRRNYLKRVMRAAFRDLPKRLDLSYDVVISLTRDPLLVVPARKPYASFESAAGALINKLNGR
jgi:ribonuclease P protein component